MNRLTHPRNNGIKSGYWSPNKKDELIERLAAYENTGLEPEQIYEIDEMYREKCEELWRIIEKHRWVPVEERLPEDNRYILLSLENFDLPIGGRYDTDTDGGRAFYLGDCDEGDTCIANDLHVNAWMSLPEPYRPEKLKEAGRIVPIRI